MWLTKQITRYFQDHCKHPEEARHWDIRKERSFERHSEWSVQWCGLCGAFRGCRTDYLVGGATATSFTDWIKPRANYN